MHKYIKQMLENKEKLDKVLSAKPKSKNSSLDRPLTLGEKKPLTTKKSIYETYIPPQRKLEFKKFKKK